MSEVRERTPRETLPELDAMRGQHSYPVRMQRAPAQRFLRFVRRNRMGIIAEATNPLAFCIDLLQQYSNSRLMAMSHRMISEVHNFDERNYAISSAYALLIGEEHRKAISAYFTPPQLAEAAMDAAQPFLAHAMQPSLLDPACGGGSFLIPAARRLMEYHLKLGLRTEIAYATTIRNLQGVEIDDGLVQLSRHLLKDFFRREFIIDDVSLCDDVVCQADTLKIDLQRNFDVVIGNPPYGRLGRIGSRNNAAWAGRANFGGHTNIYGLFLIRSLDLMMSNGILVFVLPTSFVAGPYFTGLRAEILERAEVIRIDLHEQRERLFVDAIQDVCLLVLRRRDNRLAKPGNGGVCELGLIEAQGKRVAVGEAEILPGGQPWALPVATTQPRAVEARAPHSGGASWVLYDYGYRARVGKVVPNRERDRLCYQPTELCLPLVWASDIRPDGTFKFSAGRHGNPAWYMPPSFNIQYMTMGRAVIIQRTSNRDQRRRLNAASVPSDFSKCYNARGFVAENHVIVLEIISEPPPVSPDILVALLHAPSTNARFAAVSGSYSVSVTLLARLALPNPARIPKLLEPGFEDVLHKEFETVSNIIAPSKNELESTQLQLLQDTAHTLPLSA